MSLPLDPASVVANLNDAIKEKLEVHVSYTLLGTSGNVSFWDALYWVLRWGPEIEVIEPEHLREKAASKPRNALLNYLDKKIGELTAERALLVKGLPSSH